MDPELWPARNVAEYVYCPRLFYYMQVEGLFIPSADTEKGLAVHRRVDSPSRAADADEDEPDAEKPRTVRSLVLTSPAHALTATLDLAEIEGQVAVPVEYRKGRPQRISLVPPPDDPEESDEPPLASVQPWPTDRVQVGLQAVLLEEAGYTVNEAVLYYASEKLRLRIPIEESVKADALRVLTEAKTCAQGPRPMPLVNDPRCVRCSLQPICLPDEVNQQRATVHTEETTPRKMWPPRDDGIHVVAQRQGVRIGVAGLGLKVKDRDGKVVQEVPLASVESLSLLGSVQLSTQALHVLADRCIPVAFLSAAGRPITVLDPLDSVSAAVRKAQVLRFEDPLARLELARALVVAKILNQRRLLQRNHASLPETIPAELQREAERATGATSVDTVRGHEGQAAAIYFKHFPGMLKGAWGAQFEVHGRQRRPPPDPVNTALSFAYSMLTHESTAALRLASLEPSLGAFHSTRPGRPALALDLMEPFRPLIADSAVLALFNRGEAKEGHFLRTAAGCAFTDSGRGAFFGAYGRRMDDIVRHHAFEYRLSYRRMLTLHARMIAAWLIGEVPTLAFLTTR